MDFSKYGLTEDNLKLIQEDYKKHIEKIKKDTLEPYADYENLKNALATYETNEKEYKKQINNLTKDKQTLELNYNNALLDKDINSAFYNENIKHVELFASKIDKSKLVRNEAGQIVGLKEQIDSLKETYKDLNITNTPAATTVGATPPASAFNAEPVPVDYSKLSREEAVRAYAQEMKNAGKRRF
jgi:chromosome segregation ATPase